MKSYKEVFLTGQQFAQYLDTKIDLSDEDYDLIADGHLKGICVIEKVETEVPDLRWRLLIFPFIIYCIIAILIVAPIRFLLGKPVYAQHGWFYKIDRWMCRKMNL